MSSEGDRAVGGGVRKLTGAEMGEIQSGLPGGLVAEGFRLDTTRTGCRVGSPRTA